ncbi:hypothetical protein NMG60_11017050 [Bertholletia excelsa]
MRSRANSFPSVSKSKRLQGEGPNWILIAGGALLSTLSIRLGYKLKQVLDAKQPETACNSLKGNGRLTDGKNSGSCHFHSSESCCAQDEADRFNCISEIQGMIEIKHQPNRQLLTEAETRLPLVMVPTIEFNKENGVISTSSPDCLEPPHKSFHHSNSSDSPCVSESGSDIFSKREVIQKLRQQMKRRDDMIMEMQDQIVQLQNSLSTQLSHSLHLQSLLDAANKDMLDSEIEIQRLRKAIADHCVKQIGSSSEPSTSTTWLSEGRCGHGHTSGYLDIEKNLVGGSEKGRNDGEKIEMLEREVMELKEVIEGKEYLLQSYKENKADLSMKVKELQQRLDCQLPNYL